MLQYGHSSGSITTTTMNKLTQLHRTGKNIFTAQDLSALWKYDDERKLYELIKYYVNSKQIHRLTRGLYSLNEYSEQMLRQDGDLLFEMANKLVANSYISLFSALKIYGVVFQYYDEIYSVAGKTAVKTVNGIRFVYKKIKDDALFNDTGIVQKGAIRMASLERSICDSLYFFPALGLEHIEGVSKDKLLQAAQVYKNQELVKRIEKLMGG